MSHLAYRFKGEPQGPILSAVASQSGVGTSPLVAGSAVPSGKGIIGVYCELQVIGANTIGVLEEQTGGVDLTAPIDNSGTTTNVVRVVLLHFEALKDSGIQLRITSGTGIMIAHLNYYFDRRP